MSGSSVRRSTRIQTLKKRRSGEEEAKDVEMDTPDHNNNNGSNSESNNSGSGNGNGNGNNNNNSNTNNSNGNGTDYSPHTNDRGDGRSLADEPLVVQTAVERYRAIYDGARQNELKLMTIPQLRT